jgi:hypothetical protein
VAVAAMLLLVGGGAAFAQLQSGNLYGTVVDEQGAALPGVTVTLSGQGAPQVQVTNAQGQFRFLGLSPGSYQLKSELEGFSTIEFPNVVINIGRNTSIEVTLSAAVEDVITVLGETPLLDERRISTGATVSQTELEKIPTSRDPWAILSTTPGVLTDRINVGGNESGQQSQYVGPGSGGDQAVWSVDGMVITDMAALGSSPAYYDFDSFEEMQVTTGGSDSTIATGGVVLNMVTKRGTNEWRGSGRYILGDDEWQSDTSLENSDLGHDFDGSGPATNQASFVAGNRIISVKDYGAELGGPIVKDRLWIWGAYGMQKVDLRTAPVPGFAPNGVKDFTELETANVKFNAQIAPSNSATLFALNSDKVKIGRNAGPTRPQETTVDQSKFGDDPTAYKIEDTHIFNSNFYLTGLYSVVNGGFQLVPEGGTTTGSAGQTPYLDQNGIWHHSFALYQTERPQDQYKLDASNFFNTGNLSHELKFGAGYRKAEVTSLSTWPGIGVIQNGVLLGTPGGNLVAFSRPALPSVKQEYTSAYLQDTLSVGNLTANIGVRYDKQTADNLAVSIPGNPIVPSILPAVSYAGSEGTPEWTDITPRLGVTYALGAERKTLLRASYSRFADQMGTGTASFLNPLGAQGYAYAYTNSVGGPGFSLADLTSPIFGVSANINPNNFELIQSFGLDPDLEAPLTDELLFSVEHALRPEFVVGLNLVFRQITGILEQENLVFDGSDPYCTSCLSSIGRLHQRSDYVPVNTTVRLPTGESRTITYYQLKSNVSTRGGTFLENGDREQEYQGASLTFNKRLANRWMLRGNVTWADWEWSSVPDSEREDPTITLGGGDIEGDPVLQGSGTASGAKAGVYINSEWSYNVNGLYQIAPDKAWGFNVSANITGRQGYPIPYFTRVNFPSNYQPAPVRGFIAATNQPDDFRLEDINTIDARIEKEFTFSDVGLTLGVDAFNLTNEATVLQRQHRLGLGTTNHVLEHLSPRIFRIGAPLSFR